ncbi:hypothetical protein MNV49_003250 [Pseudohyphozyma bogoriensis]|nr:hypothetical protein MNV49_003250 [Pseudohyphozyma bogoriensis]
MHGKTTGAERKDHTLEDSATCVMAAIEALQIKSYAVVGESVHGSFVGSYLAIKSPEKVCSIPEDALEIFRDYFFNGSNRLTSRCEAFANYYQARYGTNQPTHDLWFTLAPQRRKAIDPSLLAAIKVPVLIVQGGADLYTSPSAAAESWQKSFKSARGGCDLRVITGAPNMLMFTDYNIANRFILQFMSRHIE